MRRLSWEPPDLATPAAVAAALLGLGARPWQAELAAGPLADALTAAERTAVPADGAESAPGADTTPGQDG